MIGQSAAQTNEGSAHEKRICRGQTPTSNSLLRNTMVQCSSIVMQPVVVEQSHPNTLSCCTSSRRPYSITGSNIYICFTVTRPQHSQLLQPPSPPTLSTTTCNKIYPGNMHSSETRPVTGNLASYMRRQWSCHQSPKIKMAGCMRDDTCLTCRAVRATWTFDTCISLLRK
jgi:hypothetical protein